MNAPEKRSESPAPPHPALEEATGKTSWQPFIPAATVPGWVVFRLHGQNVQGWHTAACQVLRQGVGLEGIAEVLRHRSVETTGIYAKVDLGLLGQVAQPWPEGRPC